MARETPSAKELREMIVGLQVDRKLEWHLMYNHFPSRIIDINIAKKAIEMAKAGRRFDMFMPGITADAVIEELRLEDFV